jgi:hypothetical protein
MSVPNGAFWLPLARLTTAAICARQRMRSAASFAHAMTGLGRSSGLCVYRVEGSGARANAGTASYFPSDIDAQCTGGVAPAFGIGAGGTG